MTKQKIIKITLISAVGVFLMAVGGMLIMSRDTPLDIIDQNNDATAPDDAVNYSPPTEEEKQAGDAKKNTPISPTPVEPKPSDNKQVVSVIITDASQYDDIIEVRAFVPSFIQNGNCTIIFTKDAQKLEKTSSAFADASSSICTTLNIPRSEFTTSGEWNVRVFYESANASGVSNDQIIVID